MRPSVKILLCLRDRPGYVRVYKACFAVGQLLHKSWTTVDGRVTAVLRFLYGDNMAIIRNVFQVRCTICRCKQRASRDHSWAKRWTTRPGFTHCCGAAAYKAWTIASRSGGRRATVYWSNARARSRRPQGCSTCRVWTAINRDPRDNGRGTRHRPVSRVKYRSVCRNCSRRGSGRFYKVINNLNLSISFIYKPIIFRFYLSQTKHQDLI